MPVKRDRVFGTVLADGPAPTTTEELIPPYASDTAAFPSEGATDLFDVLF